MIVRDIDVIRLALKFVANDAAFKKLCKECQAMVKEARAIIEMSH